MIELCNKTQKAAQCHQPLQFVQMLEKHELQVEQDKYFEPVWDNVMCKLHVLQQDLSYFATHTIRYIPEAHAEALNITNCLLQRLVDDPMAHRLAGCAE